MAPWRPDTGHEAAESGGVEYVFEGLKPPGSAWAAAISRQQPPRVHVVDHLRGGLLRRAMVVADHELRSRRGFVRIIDAGEPDALAFGQRGACLFVETFGVARFAQIVSELFMDIVLWIVLF